jgi:hypothetical protein
MASRSTQRRHEKNRAAVRAWRYPPGTAVRVRRARGDTVLSFTASSAFLVDGCHAFVRVEGIPGNTRLDRVEAVFS